MCINSRHVRSFLSKLFFWKLEVRQLTSRDYSKSPVKYQSVILVNQEKYELVVWPGMVARQHEVRHNHMSCQAACLTIFPLREIRSKFMLSCYHSLDAWKKLISRFDPSAKSVWEWHWVLKVVAQYSTSTSTIWVFTASFVPWKCSQQ